MQSEPPPSGDRGPTDRGDAERARRRLERLLPELIKRLLETGFEKIAEGPENVRHLVGELKLPKEILQLIFSQLDETKTGLYRVAAKEIRDFLEHTNFGDELARALTTLSFEIKTEVRFIPNDSRLGASPDVRARVRMKRAEPDPTPPPSSAPRPPQGDEPT